MRTLQRLGALCACALFSTSCLAGEGRLAHLDLEVALDPASRDIRATAQLTAPSASRFLLHHTLSIQAVSADGTATRVMRMRRTADMQEWRVEARPGAMLRIDYGGTLPPLDRSLDHRRVLGAMPPMAAREGSFLHAGSGWYPRPDAPFSYSVRLSLPHDQRGLVAGRLVTEDIPRDERGRYVATFTFAHPADGIDLMVGPYIVRERIVQRAAAEALRLRTYFDRDLDGLADAYLEDSRRYIELYSAMIGTYPFTEFSVVASPLPTGFGMPTLTYVGSQVLKLPFIRATSLGHEVLHNWWGNGVYPNYARGNWSEGLTTFMADYLYKERESAAAAREMRLAWLRDFAAVPPGAHRSLAAFRSRAHGAAAAVGYGKSAMVFVMLRDLIGEDAFERGIRSFWNQYRFQVASWDDLRIAFEGSAKRSLRPFFTQWIERTGGPDLVIIAAQAARDHGAATLAVAVKQSAPAYALRVPLEIVTGTRSETRWVDIDQAHQTVTLAVDAIPDGVRLDPEMRLWRVVQREQLPPILRQWIIATAPRTAVASSDPAMAAAAHELAQRFFEQSPRIIRLSEIRDGSEPVLIIGLHDDIDAALKTLKLPPRPKFTDTRGSAQVWTIVDNHAGAPVAVISARDAASLTALLRPLPHYGAQSYLVFDGTRAIERGVWPAASRLIPVAR